MIVCCVDGDSPCIVCVVLGHCGLFVFGEGDDVVEVVVLLDFCQLLEVFSLAAMFHLAPVVDFMFVQWGGVVAGDCVGWWVGRCGESR